MQKERAEEMHVLLLLNKCDTEEKGGLVMADAS